MFRSWVQRWGSWRFPAPRLWFSPQLNQLFSAQALISCMSEAILVRPWLREKFCQWQLKISLIWELCNFIEREMYKPDPARLSKFWSTFQVRFSVRCKNWCCKNMVMIKTLATQETWRSLYGSRLPTVAAITGHRWPSTNHFLMII